MVRRLVVPRRFNGPPRSGNGGWTAGALAELVEGVTTVRVRLSRPPPLDTEIDVEVDAAGATCAVATAVPAGDPVPVDPVPADTARAAEAAYAGLRSHPFPTCFACGPEREPGDGLRIFPGPVGDGRVAATWTPHPSVAEDWHEYADSVRCASLPVTWAAVDCVGGWAADLADRPLVLGQITVRVHARPVVGAPHVVVGEHRGAEGRRTFSAATLYAADGAVVATAEHVWVAVDPAAFNRR